MQAFKELYLWSFHLKLYMGIYYVALLVVICFLRFLQGETTIEMLTVIEALAIAICIVLSQVVLLPKMTNFSKGIYFLNSCLWSAITVIITLSTAYVAKWFDQSTAWPFIILGAVMFFAVSAVLMGLKWEQELDTKRLNVALDAYKIKKSQPYKEGV